jgi:hypothetical protein
MGDDAAMSARPHIGFDTAKAGCGDQALAKRVPITRISGSLKAYSAERQPIGIRVVMHASSAPNSASTSKNRRPHASAAAKP